jgi:hypothetical protein
MCIYGNRVGLLPHEQILVVAHRGRMAESMIHRDIIPLCAIRILGIYAH